MADPNRVRT